MTERIHAPKETDNHSARLVEEYHELNREIHRVETRVEPSSEDVEEELKRRRVRLKGRDRPDAGGRGGQSGDIH